MPKDEAVVTSIDDNALELGHYFQVVASLDMSSNIIPLECLFTSHLTHDTYLDVTVTGPGNFIVGITEDVTINASGTAIAILNNNRLSTITTSAVFESGMCATGGLGIGGGQVQDFFKTPTKLLLKKGSNHQILLVTLGADTFTVSLNLGIYEKR